MYIWTGSTGAASVLLRARCTCYFDRLLDLYVTILRCYKDTYVSFFPGTARLIWMALKVTPATKQWLLKMCHLRYSLRFFLFHRKAVFCSYLKIFKFLCFLLSHNLPYLWHDECYAYKTGCILNNLLNHNSLSHQTWPIDRNKQGQWFSGIFWTIWRTGAKL